METFNTKQLQMTNRVAESNLRKELLSLSSDLHRQLNMLHKDKMDAREFIMKVRKCDSNTHPNAIRYLTNGKVHTKDLNGSILPLIPEAKSRPEKYVRKIRRLKRARTKTPHVLPVVPNLPQIKGSSSRSAVVTPKSPDQAKKPSLYFMRASERNNQLQSIKYRNYEKITSLSLDFML